jgi:hypothetical protein
MAEAGGTPDDAIMSEAPAVSDTAAATHSQHPTPDHHQHSEHQHIDPALSASAAPSTTSSPLPAAFPKKRRGRPPGRPNATVRDADYEQNPLVQAWNAAKHDRAVPVVSIGIRDALTERSLVHETQRAIFRLPSRETILFVQGWITAKHIASQRPSYVNGLLIHSRGQDAPVSCLQCTEKRAKNALGPFLTCRVLPGSYHNSCSNCKWFDNTSTCSLYTGPKPNRKRKAKDQLPPPPAAGVGPLSDADGANGDAAATAVGGNGQHDTLSTSQPPLETQPEHHQPEPPAHAEPQHPESDMTPTLSEQHEQQPTMTPPSHTTDNDNGTSAHSPPNAEASGSDLHEAPSQPESLANSHFALPKQGEDGPEVEDDDNSEFVVLNQRDGGGVQ